MPSALHFRNVDASPADAVEAWPFEGVLAALERGTLPDWRRLVRAINADPWGTVARQVEEAQKLGLPYAVGALFAEAVKTARAQAAQAEREAVAAEVRALVSSSGLTRPQFAQRIVTSASRLSTYMSGKVTPSAALLRRMQKLAAKTAPCDQVRGATGNRGKRPSVVSRF